MGRHARTLVGLEHPVAKCVLLSQRKIRLNIGRQNVLKLRVGGRVGWAIDCRSASDQVSPVHLSAIVHRHKCRVSVAEIVVLWLGTGWSQGDWSQLNGRALGVDT